MPQAPRYGLIHLESSLFVCLFVLYQPGSLFSNLDSSYQGESGAAGENGASGPMVSNTLILIECNVDIVLLYKD